MIGKQTADYRIIAKLGEGGMGEVYRATDTKLNRDVALKILAEQLKCQLLEEVEMKGILLVLIIALFGGCAPGEPTLPSTAEIRTVIEEASAAFVEAYSAGDVDTLAGFYTADGVVLAPNQDVRVGRDSVRQALSEEVEISSDLTLTTVDVEVLSDSAAIERGVYTVQVMLPGQEEPMDDRGKYIVYWKKDADGSWKLHWDIWNSDLPLSQPEQPEEES